MDVPVITRKLADILQELLLIAGLLVNLRYRSAELRRPHSGEAFLFCLLHEKVFGIYPIIHARFSVGVSRKGSADEPAFW